MKTALCALMFTFAVILFSTAAYASAQSSGGAAQPPSPTNAAPPSMTPGGTTNNAGGQRHGPCKPDVQNFCGNVPKGGGKILACLKAHVGQLSPKCEAAMKRHADRDAAKGQMPASTAPAPSNGSPPPAK